MSDTGVMDAGARLAATLTGDVYLVRRLHSPPISEGVYTGGEPHSLSASEVPCPYCRAPMSEVRGVRPYRIARVLRHESPDAAWVVGVRVPATHRILGCGMCRAHFTVPKDPVWAAEA